eukprot:scaffold198907_cov21-Tisochrysis_lutea.AAC.1
MAFSAVFMSIAVPSQVTLYFISDEAHIWAPQATGAVVLACTRACMLIAIEAIRPHSILYKCYGSHAEHTQAGAKAQQECADSKNLLVWMLSTSASPTSSFPM